MLRGSLLALGRVRHAITTCAPARASSRAVARPRPLLAPVTTATRPALVGDVRAAVGHHIRECGHSSTSNSIPASTGAAPEQHQPRPSPPPASAGPRAPEARRRRGRGPTRRASSRSRRSPGRRRDLGHAPSRRRPPAPRNRTRNHDFARCSADGPSPELLSLSSRSRAGGSCASATRPAAPPAIPTAPAALRRRDSGCRRNRGRSARAPGRSEGRSAGRSSGSAGPSPRRTRRGAGAPDDPAHAPIVWRGLAAGGARAPPVAPCRSRLRISIVDWYVPPENVAADSHEPFERDRHALGQLLDREQRAEVVRDRVEPARVDDAAPRCAMPARGSPATSGRRTRAPRSGRRSRSPPQHTPRPAARRSGCTARPS